jgi:glutamate/tyrosine decarboxylase-like PLP-dependent enzyme
LKICPRSLQALEDKAPADIQQNLADADEYPAMMDMHTRCISIISHLWNVQKGEKAVGTATTGDSADAIVGVC